MSQIILSKGFFLCSLVWSTSNHIKKILEHARSHAFNQSFFAFGALEFLPTNKYGFYVRLLFGRRRQRRHKWLFSCSLLFFVCRSHFHLLGLATPEKKPSEKYYWIAFNRIGWTGTPFTARRWSAYLFSHPLEFSHIFDEFRINLYTSQS